MRTAGYIVISISESDDYDLWKALAQIHPEKRTAFLKEALSKAIKQEVPVETNFASVTGPPTERKKNFFDLDAPNEDNRKPATLNNIQTVDRYQLDNVLKPNDTPTTILGEEDQTLMQLNELFKDSESRQNNMSGLSFLLNNVIGVENDEKVIDFIRRRNKE